jgi:arsenate reductase
MNLLFVGTHNACRSILAETINRRLAGIRIDPAWLGESAVVAHWGLPDPSHLHGTDDEREAAFQTVTAALTTRIEAPLSRPFESVDQAALKRVLDTLGKL